MQMALNENCKHTLHWVPWCYRRWRWSLNVTVVTQHVFIRCISLIIEEFVSHYLTSPSSSSSSFNVTVVADPTAFKDNGFCDYDSFYAYFMCGWCRGESDWEGVHQRVVRVGKCLCYTNVVDFNILFINCYGFLAILNYAQYILVVCERDAMGWSLRRNGKRNRFLKIGELRILLYNFGYFPIYIILK